MNADEMTFAELCEFFQYTPRGRRLSTVEAAEVLDLAPTTMQIKRSQGGGPPYIKMPGSKVVSYAEIDLLRYMLAGRRKSTSEPVRATA